MLTAEPLSFALLLLVDRRIGRSLERRILPWVYLAVEAATLLVFVLVTRLLGWEWIGHQPRTPPDLAEQAAGVVIALTAAWAVSRWFILRGQFSVIWTQKAAAYAAVAFLLNVLTGEDVSAAVALTYVIASWRCAQRPGA